MEKRALGRSGLRVSLVGLGCNNFGGRIDDARAKQVVDKAIDLGVTLFDTADVYGNRGGSEVVLGKFLGERRKEIVLATKFCMPMDDAGWLQGGSRRYIMTAVEASLRRLKTDWIDLYQIHRPDPATPIEETLRAMDDLVRQGKVRYIGCSNFLAWQVVDAKWTSKSLGLHPFVSCQDEYSLLVRDVERESIPAMIEHGIGLLPYFPLACGLLSGKYQRTIPPSGTRLANVKTFADRFLTDGNWDTVEALQDFCSKRGKTLLELAFSWLAAQRAVASIIAGATTPEQVEQNSNAAGWALTADELKDVDGIAKRTS